MLEHPFRLGAARAHAQAHVQAHMQARPRGSRPAAPRRRRAFSLVELLIVIAMLVLLTAMLLPTLAGLRHASRTAKCLAQLRALQLAHWSYMCEHDGRFVDVGLPHGNLGDEEMSWVRTMEAHYDSALVLRSPLDESPHWSRADGGEGVPVFPGAARYRRTSYGCNNYLTQYSPAADETGDLGSLATRLADVRNPASTVHFLIMVFEDEQGYCGADHVHVESWRRSPTLFASQQMQINAVDGPSGQVDAEAAERAIASRSNYGYLDGHVATEMFSAVYSNDAVNRFDPQRSYRMSASSGGAGGGEVQR